MDACEICDVMERTQCMANHKFFCGMSHVRFDFISQISISIAKQYIVDIQKTKIRGLKIEYFNNLSLNYRWPKSSKKTCELPRLTVRWRAYEMRIRNRNISEIISHMNMTLGSLSLSQFIVFMWCAQLFVSRTFFLFFFFNYFWLKMV